MVEKFSSEQELFLQNECHLAKYQIKTLNNAMKYVSFKDSVVLEVGGSNLPCKCVFDILGVKKWVCIDLIAEYQIKQNEEHYNNIVIVSDRDNIIKAIQENDYVVVQADIAELQLDKLKELFDICISMCAFEHIHRLNLALKNIYSLLRPNGILYTEFGPIFSCKYGSHYWYDKNSNFNVQDKALDYKHLLMSNMELLEFLLGIYEIEKANTIHHMFLHSERINRLFYEDYEKHMELSDFNDWLLEPASKLNVEPNIYELLKEKYPNNDDFTTYSIRIYAKK